MSEVHRPPITPPALNVSDAARYLGVSRQTIYDMIAAGKLEVVHIMPRSPRIMVAELDRLLAGKAA